MSEEAAMLTSLLDMGGQIALIAILAWLLIAERKDHGNTRAAWHADVKAANDQLIDLLTQVAGLKMNISQVQAYQRAWEEDTRARSGSRPLPHIDDPTHPAAGGD